MELMAIAVAGEPKKSNTPKMATLHMFINRFVFITNLDSFLVFTAYCQLLPALDS